MGAGGLRLGHAGRQLRCCSRWRVWLLRTRAAVRALPPLAAHGAARLARSIAQFARLGVPAGLAVLVEVTSFTLMALFIARLGTLAAAAHQIASNLAAVLYMMPLSLAHRHQRARELLAGRGRRRRARAAPCRTGLRADGCWLALLRRGC